MKMYTPFIVAPFQQLPDGSTLGSRKLTVHDTHEGAMDECQRRLTERGNPLCRYVIYQAVAMVQRTEIPIQVCEIRPDGEVSCE